MTQAHERTATLSELVAEEIRALLARQKMSGRALSIALNVSPSWVSYRLSGKQPIDVNDMLLIASALGVGVHDLLPPPEVAAQAAKPTFKVSWASITRMGDDEERRRPVNPPIMPTRHDPRRPVSAIPARKRRPQPVRPGVRPMPR